MTYGKFHHDGNNLLIHLFTVPLFIVGTLLIGVAIITLNWVSLLAGLLLTPISLGAQAKGHALEATPPAPFNGRGDFLRRIFREQFVTFPQFVISGEWWRQFRAAKHLA